jgi:hypothetical protein
VPRTTLCAESCAAAAMDHTDRRLVADRTGQAVTRKLGRSFSRRADVGVPTFAVNDFDQPGQSPDSCAGYRDDWWGPATRSLRRQRTPPHRRPNCAPDVTPHQGCTDRGHARFTPLSRTPGRSYLPMFLAVLGGTACDQPTLRLNRLRIVNDPLSRLLSLPSGKMPNSR